VKRKKTRDVNVGERERHGMTVKDLERKNRVWRKRGKKGERERETYERIQSMRKKRS
jgi:hypothetical protein